MMRPRKTPVQLQAKRGTKHERFFLPKGVAMNPMQLAKVWSKLFPAAPHPQTQVFLPPDGLDEATDDQEQMLLAIAHKNPYTTRLVIEDAMALLCAEPVGTIPPDGTMLADGATPLSFGNQWAFRAWLMKQAKNAKTTLSRAIALARNHSRPVNQPALMQKLVHRINTLCPLKRARTVLLTC